MHKPYLTPPAIARELGVKGDRVRGWIDSGELEAVNVSDGQQPRYRVSPEAFAAFLAGRAAKQPQAPKQKRQRASALEFY